MLSALKQALGFARKLDRPKPDPIAAEVMVARQRNERAGENIRELLRETLERSDGLRGKGL